MPPEIKLIMALSGSALMFNLRKSLFKSSLPGSAEYGNVKQAKQKSTGPSMIGGIVSSLMGGGGGGGGIGSMIGSLFGGGGGISNVIGAMSSATAPRQQMRGPSNVDDILRELNEEDRVDQVSTLSESEVSEFIEMPDESEVFVKKNEKGRRTLNL
jgi:hypothetical protein